MIRALTLTQPWSGLVAAGLKLVENRPRPMIKPEDFGTTLAVHAGREIDESVYDRIREIAPDLWEGWDIAIAATWPLWYRLSRITSAVIGLAAVDRLVVRQPDGSFRERGGGRFPRGAAVDLGPQQRWLFGEVGHVLAWARPLETPVTCRGWQGLWTMNGQAAEHVEYLARSTA